VVRKAKEDLAAAFDSTNPGSLLGYFPQRPQLAAMLEATQGSADRRTLTASDHELVANSHRVVARNRDHSDT
jgi:hypothetical protein